MRKQYIYKCTFSSFNLLTMTLGHYTIHVLAYNLREAKQTLRNQGFHIGKDFVYWKLNNNPFNRLLC